MKEQLQYHLYKRFEVLQKVGQGTYGLVYKVLDKRRNEVCALKKIFDAFQNRIDSQRTYRQVHYLSQTNHPRIVKLLDVITAKNQRDLYILCEFVEYDLLKTLKICDFASIQRKYVIQQLLQALSYLHDNQIAHRDIKPSNILIDRNCNVMLCDFGLARYVGANCATAEQPLTSYIAARPYRPPEVILGQQSYGTQVDIWGVGCILGQLILKRPIFNAESSNQILDKIFELIEKPKKADIRQFFIEQAQQKLLSIKSYKRISFYQKFNNATDQQIQMLTMLLEVIPQKRITAKQALKHRYFEQLETSKLGSFEIIATKKDQNQQNFSYRQAIQQISRKYRIAQKSTISISAPFTQKYKDNSLNNNFQSIFTQKPKIIPKTKKLNKSKSTIIVGENNKSRISSKKSVSKERAKSRNKGEFSTIQLSKIQKSTIRKNDKSKLKIKNIKKKSTADIDKKMFYSQKLFKDSLMQFLRK